MMNARIFVALLIGLFLAAIGNCQKMNPYLATDWIYWISPLNAKKMNSRLEMRTTFGREFPDLRKHFHHQIIEFDSLGNTTYWELRDSVKRKGIVTHKFKYKYDLRGCQSEEYYWRGSEGLVRSDEYCRCTDTKVDSFFYPNLKRCRVIHYDSTSHPIRIDEYWGWNHSENPERWPSTFFEWDSIGRLRSIGTDNGENVVHFYWAKEKCTLVDSARERNYTHGEISLDANGIPQSLLLYYFDRSGRRNIFQTTTFLWK